MDYKKQSDHLLTERVARGDQYALSELYDRYVRLVYSVALNVIGSPNTAEEITLDVFNRLWEKADTYQPELSRLSTWLTRIARNRAIDVLRKEQVRPVGHSISWSAVVDVPEADEDPEDSAQISLEMRRVRRVMASLPDNQREVLALAYLKGYTHTEIAEALDLPLGTVKGRIRAGMQKLRYELVQKAQMEDSV